MTKTEERYQEKLRLLKETGFGDVAKRIEWDDGRVWED